LFGVPLRFVFLCQFKTLVQIYIPSKDRFAGGADKAVGWQIRLLVVYRGNSDKVTAP
jgi:hypothetical protein